MFLFLFILIHIEILSRSSSWVVVFVYVSVSVGSYHRVPTTLENLETWKNLDFQINSGKTWKTQGFFFNMAELRENSGNFFLFYSSILFVTVMQCCISVISVDLISRNPEKLIFIEKVKNSIK